MSPTKEQTTIVLTVANSSSNNMMHPMRTVGAASVSGGATVTTARLDQSATNLGIHTHHPPLESSLVRRGGY